MGGKGGAEPGKADGRMRGRKAGGHTQPPRQDPSPHTHLDTWTHMSVWGLCRCLEGQPGTYTLTATRDQEALKRPA